MRFIVIIALTLIGITSAAAGPGSKTSASSPLKKMAAATGKPQAKHSAKRKPDIRILSYQQLMRLNSKRRQAYIRDLRKLMVMLETRSRKMSVAENNSVREFKEDVAALLRALEFLPVAEAREGGTETAPIRPYWVNGQGWVCTGAGAIFDKWNGTCVLGTKEAPFEVASGIPCPTGSHSIPTSNSLYVFHSYYSMCVPDSSWSLLSGDRISAISGRYWLASDYFSNPKALADKQVTIATVAGANPAAVGNGPSPSSQGTAAADAEVRTQSDKGPHHDSAADAPLDPAAQARAQAAADADAKGEAAAANCAELGFTCQDYDEVQKDPKSVEAQAARSAEENFRADRSDGSNSCISGGFFSTYRTAAKAKGECKIVRNFPADAPSPCAANQALCNPLLFCLASEGDNGATDIHQHCVTYGGSAGYDITRRCNKLYEDVRSAGQDTFRKNGKDQTKKTIACDPATVKLPAGLGLQEEWNNLKMSMDTSFSRWCAPGSGDQNFQALFCTECKVMAAIRARVTGNCTDVTATTAGAASPEMVLDPPAPDAKQDPAPAAPAPAVPENQTPPAGDAPSGDGGPAPVDYDGE